MPRAEVDLNAARVRALLDEQHPDLAHLPLVAADSGWDNVMFRLGESLAVRLPRRSAAVPAMETEQRWLPVVAGGLPLPVPAPVRVGVPGQGYPWKWSIVPWLTGVCADEAPAEDDEVAALAQFLAALHVVAPPDAPHNPYRSVPLAARDGYLRERWVRLAARTELVTERVRRGWETGVRAPVDVEPTWIHGDLHARNILVCDGAISGVVDWGDLACGDRAVDLSAVWMVFAQAGTRLAAMTACGASRATLDRARGWAVYFATVFADAGLAGDARDARLGAAIFRRIEDGP